LWQALVEQAKTAQRDADEVKDRIANFMRNAQIGTFGGETIITYKSQSRRGTTDYEGWFNDNPQFRDELKNYVKPDSRFRVLRKVKSQGGK